MQSAPSSMSIEAASLRAAACDEEGGREEGGRLRWGAGGAADTTAGGQGRAPDTTLRSQQPSRRSNLKESVEKREDRRVV